MSGHHKWSTIHRKSEYKLLTKESTKRGDESYFLRCSCYGHLLNITVFAEDLEDEQGALYLTMYGTDCRYSWVSRLREAWRLLWEGVGGGTEMVFYPDEASELGRKIVELSRRMKGRT